MDEEEVLKRVSELDDLVEMFEILDSKEMDTALFNVVKLIQEPGIQSHTAARLITQLQAISALAQWRAANYTYINKAGAGTIEYKKKNAYYALYDSLDKLVAALKFNLKQ